MAEKYRAETPDGQPVVVQKSGNFGTKILLVLMTLAVLALAGFLAASWLPRWWAQYVGGIVNGRLTVGLLAGVVAGAVFTFFPLVILRRVFAIHGSTAGRVVALVVGVLLATPTVLTLAIDFMGDSTNALHAAQRTMDDNAPNFRGGTMIGAVIGVLLALVWWYGMVARRIRRKRKYEQELEIEQLKIDKRKSEEAAARKAEEVKAAEARAAAEKEAAQKLAARAQSESGPSSATSNEPPA